MSVGPEYNFAELAKILGETIKPSNNIPPQFHKETVELFSKLQEFSTMNGGWKKLRWVGDWSAEPHLTGSIVVVSQSGQLVEGTGITDWKSYFREELLKSGLFSRQAVTYLNAQPLRKGLLAVVGYPNGNTIGTLESSLGFSRAERAKNVMWKQVRATY